MIIGYSFFGTKNNLIFQTPRIHNEYNKLELSNGVYDEIYIDEDLTYDSSIIKPNTWSYTTVLDALFQNSLEGGSVVANGLKIESILIQKRKSGELYWDSIQLIPYESGEKTLYEAIDRYVQNDYSYEYSIVPISSDVTGNRTISNETLVSFEGNFITDKDNNFQLIYDFEQGNLEHNNPSNVFEPLNSTFPIVSYSNIDYRSSSISCLIITDSSLDGKLNIRDQNNQRQKVIAFLKNKKPKVLRLASGDIMIIAITGNPSEEPNNGLTGLSKVTFSFVEVGNVDSNSLKAFGLLEGLDEVF